MASLQQGQHALNSFLYQLSPAMKDFLAGKMHSEAVCDTASSSHPPHSKAMPTLCRGSRRGVRHPCRPAPGCRAHSPAAEVCDHQKYGAGDPLAVKTC